MQPAGARPDERFLPGTILAERFRIVNLLGRGGMGEVYRATDLVLGQTVALKFLPASASGQPQARERLSNEVRAAREITHPHVCRVHDIGEVDGQLFISMEFVDGEDLASLISRIGRLPVAKANELAAGICSGLAAAHRKGLIHRDLKPANIMVDGRGQPKLMDFGLAASGQVHGMEARAGTPLYMAPEQLSGKEVTVRSDLYALGMILYELFTGKPPFHAGAIDELLAAKLRNEPPLPSSLCPEIDSKVESAILSCLAPDPQRRQASAQIVAAALPYKDALAAVLAAGDTPSPELIAASGDSKVLRPAVAYGAAAGILCALLGVYLTRAHVGVTPERPPDVLANTARELAAKLGYTANPPAVHYWFDLAGSAHATRIRFWYRESDEPFQPRMLGDFLQPPGPVTDEDPPLQPGMLLIQTDTRGRLSRFVAIPRAAPRAAPRVDWKDLFASAGLDFSSFAPAPAAQLPPVAGDALFRWTSQPAAGGPAQTVEAESWMGQAVYFQAFDPAPPSNPFAERQRRLLAIVAIVMTVAAAGLLLVALRNLRSQRSDRRGAFRVGAAMSWISAAEWLLLSQHSLTVHELLLAFYGLSWSLISGAAAYMAYLALDPMVRRIFPDMLVSLQKILTGAKRDALLGREILYGTALAVGANLLNATLLLSSGEKLYDSSGLSVRELAGVWMRDLRIGMWVGLLALAFAVPAVAKFRPRRRMRFGASGIFIAETALFCLKDTPAVPDAGAWYAQAPLLGYAAIAALVLYGARLAAGTRAKEPRTI